MPTSILVDMERLERVEFGGRRRTDERLLEGQLIESCDSLAAWDTMYGMCPRALESVRSSQEIDSTAGYDAEPMTACSNSRCHARVPIKSKLRKRSLWRMTLPMPYTDRSSYLNVGKWCTTVMGSGFDRFNSSSIRPTGKLTPVWTVVQSRGVVRATVRHCLQTCVAAGIQW